MLRVLLMSVVEHAMPYCVTDECESDDDEIDKRLRQQIALAWEVPSAAWSASKLVNQSPMTMCLSSMRRCVR